MPGDASEAWIQAQIDAAVAPYVGRLPASEIAWMRARLAETMATELRVKELVQRARPRAVVDRSGEVRRDTSTESAPEPKARRGRAG